MVWDGAPFAHNIEFTSGAPTGDITYSLKGNDGSEIVSGTVTPGVGSVSYLLVISGANNTCANPYLETRVLSWSYTTASGIVADQVMYRVDRALPLAVTVEGVRAKLGVEDHEVSDLIIDLVAAYAEFVELVGSSEISTAAVAGDRSTILCINAVEALAGLALIKTLQLRAAQSESSGTNDYKRFSKIDWRAIEDDLVAHVSRAQSVLDPTFDATGEDAFTFGTAPRSTDAVTGA